MKLYLFEEPQLAQLISMFTNWDLFTPQEKAEVFDAVLQRIKPKVFIDDEAVWLLETIDIREDA